ncbi:MAG TPA: hypothetical protein VK618_06900, partial [Flavitalea sp.]|nr:hypothetical protein [Flavitalea sp.]
IAVLGNSEKGNYRIGLSNMYQTPVTPNSNLKQQGVNFNSNFNVNKKLKVGLTANYVFEKVKNRASVSDAPGNIIAPAIYLASSFDIRWLKAAVDDNGNELVPNVDDPYTNNPYFVANYFQNASNRNRLTTGLTVRYELLDWLSVQGQLTRDGFSIDKKEVIPTGTGFLYGENGVLSQSTGNFREINGNINIEANKKFNKFSVRAIVGGNSLDNQYTESGVYGIRHFQVPYFYSPLNITNRPYQTSFSRFKVNSIYGSADLGFRDFLFLNLTARNDWFSTLNPASNNYLYPSASLSFVFSDLVTMPSWISFGKLRAAYAGSSNGTSPYLNKLSYTLEGFTIGDQPVGHIVQSSIPNQGLRPVKISEQELGLSMQFLNNRIGLDLAVYNKKTVDDILNVGVSTTTGYQANVVNIGKLRNKGIEALISATPVRTGRFTWNTSFNIAVNDNKVLALAPPDNNPVPVLDNDDNTARWGSGVSIQHVIGLPYAQIVGYAYKRNAAGQKVFDADGFPVSSDIVPVPLGSGIYKTTGGFYNEFSYKGINLSFLIDFKYGAKIYSGTNLLLYSNGQHINTLEGREAGFIGKGVTEDDKENTIAVRPQDYFYQITTGDYNIGEEFVYDASFIKFRSLSLGYSLPASILKKGFVKGLVFSLVGRNLWIIKKYTPNIDPESSYNNTNAQGLELSGYPSVRNLGFNVNVKF